MRNDETYLKMILALPDDFFENWTWKAGDKGVIVSDKREVIMLGQTGQLIWYYDRGDLLFDYGHIKNDVAMIEINYIRPIPSQEQLQNIIKLNFRNNGLTFEDSRENLYLEWRFEAWLRDQTFEEKAGLSFECLWLEFLMKAIYEKLWNGKGWQ